MNNFFHFSDEVKHLGFYPDWEDMQPLDAYSEIFKSIVFNDIIYECEIAEEKYWESEVFKRECAKKNWQALEDNFPPSEIFENSVAFNIASISEADSSKKHRKILKKISRVAENVNLNLNYATNAGSNRLMKKRNFRAISSATENENEGAIIESDMVMED